MSNKIEPTLDVQPSGKVIVYLIVVDMLAFFILIGVLLRIACWR